MRLLPLIFLSTLLMSAAQNYSVQRTSVEGVPVVRLTDEQHHTTVAITPTLGNNAFELSVNGRNYFWLPTKSLAELQKKPQMHGNPFLGPWANRLDHEGFFANGKEYRLNPALKNYNKDGHGKPIHGLLMYASWDVTEAKANEQQASVTSRLEFWRHPDWMAQFPFAHTIEMTYTLRAGVLEVATRIQNHAAEAMPLSLGFHPYFTLHDAPRDQWTVTLPAKQRVLLSEVLIPTGVQEPSPYQQPHGLAGIALDDVFADLVRGDDRTATFSVKGKSEQVSVVYGPKYPIAVVYAPPGRDFICFEPMTGPTNAFNLSHEGKYKELQSIPAGGEWRESFWIKVSGQ